MIYQHGLGIVLYGLLELKITLSAINQSVFSAKRLLKLTYTQYNIFSVGKLILKYMQNLVVYIQELMLTEPLEIV